MVRQPQRITRDQEVTERGITRRSRGRLRAAAGSDGYASEVVADADATANRFAMPLPFVRANIQAVVDVERVHPGSIVDERSDGME